MSETGRYRIIDLKTGKVTVVEPIDKERTPEWGDLNPATGKIEGDYSGKYKGSITEEESIITEENGFTNIRVLSSPNE